MTNHDNLSPAAALKMFGLQTAPSFTQRFFTYAAFATSGVLLGVAVGVLLAPKSGRALRADLRGKVKGISSKVAEGAERVVDNATEAAHDAYPPASGDGIHG